MRAGTAILFGFARITRCKYLSAIIDQTVQAYSERHSLGPLFAIQRHGSVLNLDELWTPSFNHRVKTGNLKRYSSEIFVASLLLVVNLRARKNCQTRRDPCN